MWDGGERCVWGPQEFHMACKLFYEVSYRNHITKNIHEHYEFLRQYGECIDNALTNVESGCDYTKQESFSTHIQDIAIRNVMRGLGWHFNGPADKILVIRSADSEGYRYGPGNIPFAWPEMIATPSLCPHWANPGSVEDFWQSNKYVFVRE